MSKKKIIIKTMWLVLTLIILQGIDNIWSQQIANYLALQQMNNTVDSSAWIQGYTYFSNFKYLIIIAAALLYKNEIRKLINFLRRRLKTNEEKM